MSGDKREFSMCHRYRIQFGEQEIGGTGKYDISSGSDDSGDDHVMKKPLKINIDMGGYGY